MEVLWNFRTLKIEKWKPLWKSPYWNFMISQNKDFANTKRETFAEGLRFLLCSGAFNFLYSFFICARRSSRSFSKKSHEIAHVIKSAFFRDLRYGIISAIQIFLSIIKSYRITVLQGRFQIYFLPFPPEIRYTHIRELCQFF